MTGGEGTDSGGHATRREFGRALRTAVRMVRARWVAVVVAMLCVQAAVITVMPLLTSLVSWSLRRLGVDGVNLYTLETVLSSPTVLLVLVGIAGVATVFVLTELTLFAVIGHLVLDGEPLHFRAVGRRSWQTVRKAAGWQGLLLVPYLTLLLPISGIGFSSVMTERIALPKFISGELLKTTSGGVLYAVVAALLAYAMLQFILFPALVAGRDTTILQALVRSARLITWRTLIGLGVILLGAGLLASLAMTVLGAVGLLPVALAGTHAAAGVVLGLLGLARFVVAGLVTAFAAFVFVAFVRPAQDGAVEVPRAAPAQEPAPTRWTTRTAATCLVVMAGLTAMPQVIASSEAAVLAEQAEPQIIGHRGYPVEEVENSIAGLRAAETAGADLVETDIQETADGGWVVMHDVSLERLTGVDQDVYDLTEAEVTALTLRQDGRTAAIPTLAEFVEEADARGIRLLVEVKPHGQEAPGFARRVTEELARLDPDHTHMIQSLDRGLIEEIAQLDPQRPTAFVVGFQIGELPQTTTGAVVIEDWSFRDGMLVEAHEQGRDLFVWTVNDLGPLTDYMARGVDGIITDRVTRAVGARERQDAGPVSFYLERARGLVAMG